MPERRSKTEEGPGGKLAATRPAQALEDQHNQNMQDTWRLNMDPANRVVLAATASLAVGGGLGLSQGSTMAGMKFRAEHAHKLPTTPTGWFMYHKSKNYNMARAGLKEGCKMGFKVGVVTTAMFLIEDLYDEYRQTKDFINTTLASLTVAGGFSLWSMTMPLLSASGAWLMMASCSDRFSLPTTARTTKTALVVGLVYGGLQDMAGAVRGRPIGYIDWTRRRLGLKESNGDGKEVTAP